MPDKKTTSQEAGLDQSAEEQGSSIENNENPAQDKSDDVDKMSVEIPDEILFPDEAAIKAHGGEASDISEKEAELKDQLLRALADVENIRRRSERDVAQANKYAHLSFARDLLSCFDNLSQAIALSPEDKSDLDENLKNILVGVEMISNEIDSVLQRHKITKIDPVGEKFDYNHHQAMFEVQNDEIEPGTVVQVAQPGYLLHDRLLRPAMVGVSKKVSQTESDDTSSIDKQA